MHRGARARRRLTVRRRPAPLARAGAVLALLLGTLLVAVPSAGAAESVGEGPAVRLPAGVEGPVGGERLGSRGAVLPDRAAPPPAELTAQAWLVADLDTGEVLAARDPHGLYAPASTIKTLTALTFLPRLEPDQHLRPVWDDVAVEGSRVGVVETMTYPARDLFLGLMLMSGNDAAGVLARSAGSLERGVAAMNETARDLQAYDTVARTPHGLDAPGQSSSAYDLALIARAALEREDFRRIVSTRCTDIAAPDGARLPVCNKNKLLGSYDGAFGVKNGYTSAAGASFVGAAERDGRRLVVTLLAAEPQVWAEAALLLDWGFTLRPGTGVGTLVPPAADAVPGAAVEDAASLVAASPPPPDGGLLPRGALTTVLLLLLGTVVVLRARAVEAERRRRAAARARRRAAHAARARADLAALADLPTGRDPAERSELIDLRDRAGHPPPSHLSDPHRSGVRVRDEALPERRTIAVGGSRVAP